MSDHNVKVVKQLFEAINHHNLSPAKDHYAENYTGTAPGRPQPMNYEQSTANTQLFLDAFPDLKFEVTMTIAEGDHVVANWTATGTHNNPLPTPTGSTLPATGKRATVPGSTTYKFNDGKIVYSAVYWDMVGLLAQLGLMPGM